MTHHTNPIKHNSTTIRSVTTPPEYFEAGEKLMRKVAEGGEVMTRQHPTILRRLINSFRRPPDFIIGNADAPYMLRWYILPRNRWFNVYLHKIVRDDDDRALHDHPWPSLSLVLKGSVRELRHGKPARLLRRGRLVYRSSTFRHRLELMDDAPCWTLFITGPRLRVWGFWCPQGFVPWHVFVDPTDHGQVGRGCGEMESNTQ